MKRPAPITQKAAPYPGMTGASARRWEGIKTPIGLFFPNTLL